MAALTSLTIVNATHVTAGFSAAVAGVEHSWNWQVTSPTPALGASVVKATVRADNQTVDLVLSPGMSKTKTYTFTALHATLPDGTPLAGGDKIAAVVNTSAAVLSADLPYRLFEAVVLSLAEETAILVGKPQTLVVDEWQDNWDVLPVESTLGFPGAATIWLEGLQYTYTAKDPAAFRGVSPVRPSGGTSVAPQAVVTLDLFSVV